MLFRSRTQPTFLLKNVRADTAGALAAGTNQQGKRSVVRSQLSVGLWTLDFGLGTLDAGFRLLAFSSWTQEVKDQKPKTRGQRPKPKDPRRKTQYQSTNSLIRETNSHAQFCHTSRSASACQRAQSLQAAMETRSEERRVGKECRSRWSPYH